jgi:hypothetical protein
LNLNEEPNMKIEIGKKYVTRSGEHVTVVSSSAAQGYPFLVVSDDGEHFTCTEQGEVWGFGAPNGRDLVDEREPCAEERFEELEERYKELEEKLACSERARQKWEETAASVASVRDYFSRIIKEVADAIGPAAYTSDDGSVQLIPLRARLACRVQDLQSTILEQERQLQRYKALLPSAPPAPPALELQVGDAYLTCGGDVVIIESSDEDEQYPFNVEMEDGSRWPVTRSGRHFRSSHHSLTEEGDDDLVTRIRFPEPPVGVPAVPEGFVYVGSEAPEGYNDTGDLRVCYSADGSGHFSVCIGSPVHFAFATKFRNEA